MPDAKSTYYQVSSLLSKQLTLEYSTSFGLASRLFDRSIRQHIYAIYGFVRIADEIVDTFNHEDAADVLEQFKDQTYQDLQRGFSTNPILQSFIQTCNRYDITKELIEPFFKSMLMDTKQQIFTQKQYEQYIYGSAEVVGLMCLKVFCENNHQLYSSLAPGAQALGSAFQKVNFLRDIADDHKRLGRYYFPVGNYQTFNDKTKAVILADIKEDFANAQTAILGLPVSAQKAVLLASRYFEALTTALEAATASQLKQERIRIPYWQKILLLVKIRLGFR